jgi:hypothetical protein
MLRILICLFVLALASTMVLAQESTETPGTNPPPGAACQFQPVMFLVLLPAFLYSLL